MPETSDALRLLEASAHKYGEIGSYELSVIARRPRADGLTYQVGLKFAYAPAKMTPPELQVPTLPQVIQMGPFEVLDQHKNKSPPKGTCSFSGPGSAFSFDQVAWRVTSAKTMGSAIVNSHPARFFEVQYEGTRRNPNGEPVRYWIDPETRTTRKMQFSEPDALSKNGDLARWRMQRRSRSASLVLDLGIDPFQVALIAGLVEWPETSKARFHRHESDT